MIRSIQSIDIQSMAEADERRLLSLDILPGLLDSDGVFDQAWAYDLVGHSEFAGVRA